MIFKKIIEMLGAVLLVFLLQVTHVGSADDMRDMLRLLTEALSGSSTETPEGSYQVMEVVDGDTLKVEIAGRSETIRLIGIDTPEVVDPRKPVQCFGQEASQKAKELLVRKRVSLEADPTQGERDKYGRLLRYVFLEDGTSFNRLMIEEGYAHEYTYQSNPYQYQMEFQSAERSAREGKRGLWNENTCHGVTSGVSR